MGKTTKDLFFQLARAAGYCCPYSLLRANKKTRASIMAKRLGIHKRTYQLWLRAFKTQSLVPCAACPPKDRDMPLELASPVDEAFSPAQYRPRRKPEK